jgi:hypothetical protein
VKRERQNNYAFKITDGFAGKRRVTKKEFLEGCIDLQLSVSEPDVHLIWAYLAEGNNEGTVDVAALLSYAQARGPPSKSQLIDKSYLSLRANDRMLVDETTGEQRKERIRMKTEYADKLHTLVRSLRRAIKLYCESYEITPQKLFSKFRKRRDGLVELGEVLECLRVCQLVITSAQMQMMWPLLDVQGRGGIGLANWENFLKKRMTFSYKNCEDKYFGMPHAKELDSITGSWLPGVGGSGGGSGGVSKPKPKQRQKQGKQGKSKTLGWVGEARIGGARIGCNPSERSSERRMPRWARERANLYKTEKPFQPIRFCRAVDRRADKRALNSSNSVSSGNSISNTLSISSSMSRTQGKLWKGHALSDTARKALVVKEREAAKRESMRATTQSMTQLLSREEMGKVHSEEQILAAEKIAGVARIAVGIRMAERIILRQLHLRKLGAMLAQEMSDELRKQSEHRRVLALTGANNIEPPPSPAATVYAARYAGVGWGRRKSSSADSSVDEGETAKSKPSLFGAAYSNRPPVAWRAQSARSGHVLLWHMAGQIPCRLSICRKPDEENKKKGKGGELCVVLKHYASRTEKKALVDLSAYLEMSFQGLDRSQRQACIYNDVMSGLPTFVSYEQEMQAAGGTDPHAPVHFVSEMHLQNFLSTMNIDVSQYGKENAKTVEQLREEINSGGCRLRIVRSRIGPLHPITGIHELVLTAERVLTAVNVALRSKEQPDLVLFETARTEANGTTSQRKGHKCIPSKKLSPEQMEMPKNQAVQQCALEILQDQLKLNTACVRIIKGSMNTSMLARNSNAFPGISTKYCIYRVDAELKDSDILELEKQLKMQDESSEGADRINGIVTHQNFDTRVRQLVLFWHTVHILIAL